MSEIEQARFSSWAIVEVMGHQRYAGFVSTEAYGQAVLFRVDVPALEARERVTKAPGYVNNRYCPAGTKVMEGAVPGFTKLVGAGSIYCITPCSKEMVEKTLDELQHRPLMSVELPPERGLAEGAPGDPIDVEVDEDDDEDHGIDVDE